MEKFVERVDLPASEAPGRWYNAVPDLPRLPDEYLDPATKEPVSSEYMARLMPRSLLAQDFSLENWIGIPRPVLDAYRLWRPTPLYRAVGGERHHQPPAPLGL
jgi:tryptophan synthase beta chain